VRCTIHFTAKDCRHTCALHLLQNDCSEITTSGAALRHTPYEVIDMQRIGIYLFSAALTLVGYAARAAGDTKAAELLAQARAAIGGDSKVSKVQALSCTGTLQRALGDRQIGGDVTIDLQLPDKFLRTDSISPMGDGALIVTEQGVNGDKVLRNSK